MKKNNLPVYEPLIWEGDDGIVKVNIPKSHVGLEIEITHKKQLKKVIIIQPATQKVN